MVLPKTAAKAGLADSGSQEIDTEQPCLEMDGRAGQKDRGGVSNSKHQDACTGTWKDTETTACPCAFPQSSQDRLFQVEEQSQKEGCT